MSTFKFAVIGASSFASFTTGIRKLGGADSGDVGIGVEEADGLEQFLEKDWLAWAQKEETRINKELGFEELEDQEYDSLQGSSALDINETNSFQPSPCTRSFTPCINGKRGWTHTCSEKVERSDPEVWRPVSQQVSCVPVAIQAGDAKGAFFTYENYGRTMTQVFGTFSGGKRPGAVAAARSVAAGNMTFDTKANEVFEWWTKDENDSRSRVTLGDLLHFTSGFIVDSKYTNFDHDHGKHSCLNSRKGKSFTMEQCAQQLYSNTRHVEPNTQYQYNSLHVQLAVAMAVKRSGLPATQYLRENLYEPAGMTNTHYGGNENPFIAGGMMTTGNDYGSFLRAYLGYTILPKNVTDQMEAEYRNSHNIPDVGTLVRMPDFGMCMFHLEGFPECLNMGGSQQNCINRATGTYWMLLPRVKEYYGRALGGGALVSAMVLMNARFWIHEPLNNALHPLGKQSSESTTETTTAQVDEEALKKQLDAEGKAAVDVQKAEGVPEEKEEEDE